MSFTVHDDILSKVFLHLEINSIDVLFASFTCRQWYRIATKTFCDDLHELSIKGFVSHPAMVSILDKREGNLVRRHPLPGLVIEGALKFASLENIKSLFERINIEPSSDHFQTAAERGDLEVMKWIYDRGCRDFTDISKLTAASGNLESLQWLCDVECPIVSRAYLYALSSPNPRKVFDWLLEKEIPPEDDIIALAIRNGHDLCFIKWMILSGKFQPMKKGVLSNADKCKVEVASFLVESGYLPSVLTSQSAAMYDNYELLEWLIEKKFPVGIETMIVFVDRGDLQMVKLLHSRGQELVPFILSQAVKHAHFPIMNWLFDMKCPHDDRLLFAAPEGGIEVIKWVLEKNYGFQYFQIPYDMLCLSKKERRDDRNRVVVILDWLRQNGLFRNNVQCIEFMAIVHDNLPVFKLMIRKGTSNLSMLFQRAAIDEKFTFLKWMLENWELSLSDLKIILSQIRYSNIDIYEWMLSKGLCTTQAQPRITWKK